LEPFAKKYAARITKIVVGITGRIMPITARPMHIKPRVLKKCFLNVLLLSGLLFRAEKY
jgi:hypothetical protein